MEKVLYQTTEDRGNPKQVLSQGPFICKRKDTWFGEGYYFWDTYLEFAHKWGKKVYGNGKYIITKYIFDYNVDNVFDLTNATYMRQFVTILNIIKRENNKVHYVKEVIEFMKETGILPASCVGVISRTNGIGGRISDGYISFNGKYPAKLYYGPDEIQVCLFNKTSLRGGSAEIVHPDKYCGNKER